MLTPSARFARIAGVALVIGALSLGGVASLLIQDLFVRETLTQTEEAVRVHLLRLFPRDVFGGGLDERSAPAFDRLVRAHFDLYRIRHAAFYDRQGRVTYSYDPSAYAAGAAARAGAGGASAAGGSADANGYGGYGNYGGDLSQAAAPLASGHGAPLPAGSPAVAANRYPRPLPPAEVARLLAGAEPVRQVTIADPETGQPIRALHAVVPLREGGGPIGAVEVYRDAAPLFGAIRRIQAALLAAIAVGVALLYLSLRRIFASSTAQLRRQTEQLRATFHAVRDTYETTLAALTSALDQRDATTQGHSVRVVAFACAIAERLGIRGNEMEHLLRGALLHDIGKIGVSDAILRKPGKLTPGEWREMRRHPEIGYQILLPIPFLAGALPVVLYHHERWDGSGYPAGLRGEEIPRAARVFAVADVFDAMTSDRPYRPALTFEQARDHLIAERGRLYDPEVVDAFLRIPAEQWGRLADGAAALQCRGQDLRKALGLAPGARGAAAAAAAATEVGPAGD